jgi:hypothetical protein
MRDDSLVDGPHHVAREQIDVHGRVDGALAAAAWHRRQGTAALTGRDAATTLAAAAAADTGCAKTQPLRCALRSRRAAGGRD